MISKKQNERNDLIRLVIALVLFGLAALTFINLFAYLRYDGDAINRKNFSNWTARNLGRDIESNAELLGLPEKGEVFISGGADRYANYAVAAYTPDGKTVYLRGDENTVLTRCWTARVQDRKPQEVWYSVHQLTEDELRPYRDYEQSHSMHYVPFPLPHSWIDDTKLVGYWKRSDTDET